MSTPYRRDLERLQYWQGQTLRSGDARDQGRFDALRRQLHNRALHATGGIVFGLQVQPVADDPQRVEVACGLAYDLRGRELLLQRSRQALLPAQAGWLVLRVRPAARDSASCCVPVDPGCMPPEGRMLEQEVELGWVTPASHESPGDVVLARFDGTHLDGAFMPMQARPLAKPRLARGETVKGNTPWEPWIVEQPDEQGGFTSKAVGVQTHVDTSASGFTRTPHYMANLQAPTWNLAEAEFAPAFFPQVADPAPDGFTFRLLMTEIARRRVRAAFGSTRVTKTVRGVGDQLAIEVDDGSVFRVGDVVAQLRPRARTAVTLAAATKTKLTLSGPLAGIQPAGTVLAVGNLPRISRVGGVSAGDPAMVATYTAAPPVAEGDILHRTSDGALALIDDVDATVLTVEKPFLNWNATDALMVARLSGAADVQTKTTSTDGMTLELGLQPATHGIAVGMTIAMLDTNGQPLASTPVVQKQEGATIHVQPLPSAAEIDAVRRVAPFAGGLAIQGLSPKNRSLVEVDNIKLFAIGDFVAAADDPRQIAVVEKVIKNRKQLSLSAALNVSTGSMLVAADWQCATTIAGLDPKHPETVRVGRADAAREDDVVALRATDDVGSPVSVASVSGTALTLAGPLVGAVRLDTLAIGRFGRVATVVVQQANETQITITNAGALVAGDCVMRWPASGSVAAEAAVVQVASASGTQVFLAESLGRLETGDRIATVQWRDSVDVTTFDAADPTHLGIDGKAKFGENDVVGVLSHHGDVSNGGYVRTIVGKLLTLIPGVEEGDGIVDRGWIDGGIVGPAALAYDPALPYSFFAPTQPVLRMETLEGLEGQLSATAYGFDLLTGVFQSRAVLPFVLDTESRHLFIRNAASTPAYRFRPETLSLITRFNNDFPAAFATFAQKQELVVRWFGSQQEFLPVVSCPGQAPYDPCKPAD